MKIRFGAVQVSPECMNFDRSRYIWASPIGEDDERILARPLEDHLFPRLPEGRLVSEENDVRPEDDHRGDDAGA